MKNVKETKESNSNISFVADTTDMRWGSLYLYLWANDLPNLSQEFSRLAQAVLSMRRLLTAFARYQSTDPPCIPLLHEGVYSFLWLCNELSQTQQLEAVHIYHLPVHGQAVNHSSPELSSVSVKAAVKV